MDEGMETLGMIVRRPLFSRTVTRDGTHVPAGKGPTAPPPSVSGSRAGARRPIGQSGHLIGAPTGTQSEHTVYTHTSHAPASSSGGMARKHRRHHSSKPSSVSEYWGVSVAPKPVPRVLLPAAFILAAVRMDE